MKVKEKERKDNDRAVRTEWIGEDELRWSQVDPLNVVRYCCIEERRGRRTSAALCGAGCTVYRVQVHFAIEMYCKYSLYRSPLLLLFFVIAALCVRCALFCLSALHSKQIGLNTLHLCTRTDCTPSLVSVIVPIFVNNTRSLARRRRLSSHAKWAPPMFARAAQI